MRVGGPGADWGAGFKTALVDAGVSTVASHLHAARDQRVLDYAMFATSPIRHDYQVGMLQGRLRGTALAAVNAIDPIARAWRTTLGKKDLGYRKGAIIQKLVERLIGNRPGGITVYPERRLILSTGDTTSGLDVLAVPATGAWEAHECKASYDLTWQQEKELTWMARTEGSGLMVCVTSAASSTALRSVVARIKGGSVLFYVGAEKLFLLDALAPRDRVSSTP